MRTFGRTRGFGVVAVVALILTLGLTAQAQRPPAGVVPGSYIVQVADGASAANVAQLVVRRFGGIVGHIYTEALNGFSIQLPRGVPADRMFDYRAVVSVEPDLMVFALQQTLPTGVDRIDVDLNATAKIDGIDERVDVDIAIIDTGIDIDHPDLNVVGGRRLLTIDWPPPKRAVYDDANYDDDDGHGTHVAGTAAAFDNDIGVVGVAPGARLWGIKVLPASRGGILSDVIKGIDWATAHADEIEVVNMSLGGWEDGYSSQSMRQAIQNSVAEGIVYVVAAGNSGEDIYGADGNLSGEGSSNYDDFIPAAYPEVMAVSAMADYDGEAGGAAGDGDDSFAGFSNYSASVVSGNLVVSPGAAIDLLLPGVSIYSADKKGGYTTKSGTSMASPHAAGLAALYIAAKNLDPNSAAAVYAIRQALIDGGVPQHWCQGLATLNDPDSNWENVGWAGPLGPQPPVANAGPDQVVTDDDENGWESVTLNGSDSYDPDGTIEIESYNWYEGEEPLGSEAIISFDFTVGQHTVTLTVADNDNFTDTDEMVITVKEPSAEVRVDSISPGSMSAGTTINVAITGSGFVDGAEVTFENGDGPAPKASNVVVVDSSEITASVTAKSGGPPRNRVWDVRVTNPDGSSGVLEGGLTVTP